MSAPPGLLALRATWMRGGAQKAFFLAADDLPKGLLQRPSVRDALLSRLVGSPHRDPRMIDGVGHGGDGDGGRIVIASRSLRPDCDVEFLHGLVSTTAPLIDWSQPCDQLAAAVASFAIGRGWVVARTAEVAVRLRQQVTEQSITAWVPTRDGVPLETGTFDDDGVPFGTAETRLEFVDPAAGAIDGLFPTGLSCDEWHVPGLVDVPPAQADTARGTARVTWLDLATPLLCVRADTLKLTGRETPDTLRRDAKAMARLATLQTRIAAHAAARGSRADEPRIALVAAPATCRTFDGRDIDAQAVDVLVRLFDGDQILDGCPGHAAMALAVAAALPGTVVSEVARTLPGVPTRIGHPSGIVTAGALLARRGDGWHVERTTISRSARRLMDGTVYVPAPD